MDAKYAAGFFDGEGCVSFTRTGTSIYPRVNVTNTDISILEEFKATWGGDIKPLSHRKDNWKQGYSWRLAWSRAVGFLDTIRPHLRIKTQQADTVFAWDAIRIGAGRHGKKVKEEYIECCDLLIDRMHWLNMKGPKIGNDPIDSVLSEIEEGKA